jgi:hypothetical protein
MMDVLVQLEESGIGTWVRESNSLLAYPSILFLHTLGMGLLAGVSGLIDLRILGVGSEIPLVSMEKFVPYMWAGFWLNAVTGIALFIPDATTKATSPVFYTKMGFVIAAMVLTSVIKSRVFRDPLVDKRPVPMNGRLLALASILCWLGAITAGRLLAYVGPGTASGRG